MNTADRYLAVHNLKLLQRQAGVDAGVAELVGAYARLLVDSGEPLVFDQRPWPADSIEQSRFDELQQRNPDTDDRFLAFLAAYSARMIRRGFVPLTNRADLAERLGYEANALSAVVARAATCYREIRLPRKNGSFRVIHSPEDSIRTAQEWILRHILRGYRPHDAAHGFVLGRSIVTNASRHVGHAVLVMIDLADFFPTITFRRVRKGFERLGYPYSVAVVLANLCSREGRLPQGAPTSPAISNLICERLDARLTGLAQSRGFSYSRYADDLAFSSDDRRLPTLIPFLKEIVSEEGFQVRAEKTRIARRGARQMVTGVVVHERPNLPREYVRKLRAAVHRLGMQGPAALEFNSATSSRSNPMNVLAGHVAFLSMVNRERGRVLAASIRSSRPSSADPSELV